jgi:DNA (cytosine-5)-methyltransferase 1
MATANTGGNPTLYGAAVGYRPTEVIRHGRDAPDWAVYTKAIRRAEATMGRPAPPPTTPGPKGPQLSPAFVEWLMMLPEGHVTGVPGISRNDQLRALGNGVVPPQAAAALRAYLRDESES